jgi:predicted RNA binding protein YcfA (HicA-like mRNA interferase family)
MRAREVIRKIEQAKCGNAKACQAVRQEGSHIRFECNCNQQTCKTSVPDHGTKDLGRGLLHSIERDLEPCLGERWLTR